jgi:hypothetical protein
MVHVQWCKLVALRCTASAWAVLTRHWLAGTTCTFICIWRLAALQAGESSPAACVTHAVRDGHTT